MDPHTSPDRLYGERQQPSLADEESDENVEYALAPTNGVSRDEMEARFVDPELLKLATSPPPIDPNDSPRRFRIQFSIRHIFWIMNFAAIGLAAARWLPSSTFTFLAGVVVLGALWHASRDNADDPVARLVLVGVVTAYVALLFAFRLMAI